jgi:hypothetical protein
VSAAGGGFYKTPSKSALKELVGELTWALDASLVTGNLIDVHSSTWAVWRYSQPSVICITARLETNEA